MPVQLGLIRAGRAELRRSGPGSLPSGRTTLHAEVPCSVGYEARRLNRARHHLAAASGLDRDRRCFHEVLVGDPGLHQELGAEPVIGEFVPAATQGGSGSARTHGLRRGVPRPNAPCTGVGGVAGGPVCGGAAPPLSSAGRRPHMTIQAGASMDPSRWRLSFRSFTSLSRAVALAAFLALVVAPSSDAAPAPARNRVQ
jgi:hypothetical protein